MNMLNMYLLRLASTLDPYPVVTNVPSLVPVGEGFDLAAAHPRFRPMAKGPLPTAVFTYKNRCCVQSPIEVLLGSTSYSFIIAQISIDYGIDYSGDFAPGYQSSGAFSHLVQRCCVGV
jgi:hypothetical protein